jgi:hypothetical protein
MFLIVDNPSGKRRKHGRKRKVHRRRKTTLNPMAAKKHRRRRRRRTFTNPVKSSRKGRRRGGRRRGGSRRFSLNSLGVGALFSKQNLTLAAGVVGAGIVTTIVFSRFANSLPGLVNKDTGETNTMVATAYAGAIPLGAAFLLRRFAPQVATGVALGGLIAVVNQLTRPVQAQLVASLTTSSGTMARPGLVPSSRRIGEYFPARRGVRGPSGYSAMTAFGASPYGNSPAFSRSAW